MFGLFGGRQKFLEDDLLKVISLLTQLCLNEGMAPFQLVLYGAAGILRTKNFKGVLAARCKADCGRACPRKSWKRPISRAFQHNL